MSPETRARRRGLLRRARWLKKGASSPNWNIVNDWYACTLGLCRWCLLTGYISSKRLKRLLKKRWRLGAF
jgi:hypothetical protein